MAEIESLLYSYYIKYESLMELNTFITPNNKEYVNIYIDLFDLISKIYKSEYKFNKRFIVTSCIINLVGHYRSYYRTRHRLWTRIYLVYADETTNNHRMYIPTFGDKSYEERYTYPDMHEQVLHQLDMVKILCGYINDVYYVNKKSNFCMFTYECIRTNPEDIHICVTRSRYAYQLPAFNNNTYIFRPRKTLDGDLSYCVKFNTILYYFYIKIKTDKVMERLSQTNPQLLSVFMCMNGLPEKHLKACANITKSSMIIYDAIENNRIINGYNSDTRYLYSNLIGINTIMDSASFDYRFKALDLVYQHMLYVNSVESKDYSWFINLSDSDTVKEINNKYFIDNPLILENL